ncbi:MAG TPA: DUF2804 family protein, partial [Dehalococcoidia bacterium]|nr:DUF2804 family protein [Dehalococcoidia bacterium]
MTTTHDVPAMHPEREIEAPVALCGADGKLNPGAVAWSRHPLHRCNLPASLARKKKWNYWAVTDDQILFSATIADIERLQLGGCYLYHRATKRHIEATAVQAPGTLVMPEGVGGDIVVDRPGMRVALLDAGAGTRIQVHADDFGGVRLDVDILVERPAGHE